VPESRLGENVAFTQRHFWVTKYKPDEMYAAGEFANQASPEYRDHLGGWATDENIFKEDLVAWYSMAYTHVAKPEDFPIMPAGKISVDFAPKGFFEKSPGLGLATIEKRKLKD
jgi:primary-amine oxidase